MLQYSSIKTGGLGLYCGFVMCLLQLVSSVARLLTTVATGRLATWQSKNLCEVIYALWVTFRANIYGPLDGGMVILQLCAGSLHRKKLCSRLYSIEIKFYSKTKKKQKVAVEQPFEGLRGNVQTPSIARWKALGRLPIRHDWFFPLSHTVETL